MTDMRGHVALVTGGGSGIGAATALAFAQAGADVAICDYHPNGGSSILQQIERMDRRAILITCDVRKADDVASAVSRTVDDLGRLDYAFNNAGVEGISSPIADAHEDDWRKTIDTNLLGVWLCIRAELRAMQPRNGAAIVNCSSVAGLIGIANAAAYVASKHGVVGLTKSAALEAAPNGIRVNAVCPGAIETPMLERAIGDQDAVRTGLVSLHPLGRFGRPEEVAHAARWLCSDEASFVTGQALAVDGGWTTA